MASYVRIVSLMFLLISLCELSRGRQSQEPAHRQSGDGPPRHLIPYLKGEKQYRLPGEKHYRRGVKEDTKRSKTARPGSTDGGNVLSIRTDMVVLEAQVLDREGRAVSGLADGDFEVTEDRVTQQIVSFNTPAESREPLSIILLLDWSGSVYEYIKESLRGAEHLVASLGEREELAIVTDDVKLLCDYTNDKVKLREKLRKLRAEFTNSKGEMNWKNMWGSSKQFTALKDTLLSMLDEERERIIVIVESDGDEHLLLRDTPCGWPGNMMDATDPLWGRELSYLTTDVLLQVARWSRAPIYSLIPQRRLTGLTDAEAERRLEEQYRQGRFKDKSDKYVRGWFRKSLKDEGGIGCRIKGNKLQEQVAEISGGWAAYLNQPESAPQLIDRILAEARGGYTLSYYPTNTALDGAFRRVRVRVKNHPEYIVRSREGYYAFAR